MKTQILRSLSLSKGARQSILIVVLALFISCSSAPKRSMQVSTIYSSATEMIESANACILSGDYDKASFFLSAAESQAMSIDNYDLLTAAALARCSLKLSLNPPEVDEAQQYVDYAKKFVKNCADPKKQQAIVDLSQARVSIAKGSFNGNLENIKKELKSDDYYSAQVLQVEGDVYKLKQDYAGADKAYTAAAKAFTDSRYLSEIGICWYKAAQARSLNGNKDGALQAMEQAIFYDRAAENSLGLGTDYYAVGLILIKGNPSANEKERAREAFIHSAEIFTSVNADELAKRSREVAEEIQ